jgi:tellurite resistance protein TehA-like permease
MAFFHSACTIHWPLRHNGPEQNDMQRAKRHYWQPNALRPSVLIFTGLLSLTLAAIIQGLTAKSQRNQGLIFHPNIENLPLSRTISFNYLCTIISILYALVWGWIDLDAKTFRAFLSTLATARGAWQEFTSATLPG